MTNKIIESQLEFIKEQMQKNLEQFIGQQTSESTIAAIKAHMIQLTYDLFPRPEWEVQENPNNSNEVVIVAMNEAAIEFLRKYNA